jgi:hypothetical protein
MPVTYYSSTGSVSFAPVAPRDQAVGPMAVATAHSPPDEIIEPRRDGNSWMSHRSQTLLGIAVSTAIAVLIFAAPIS